MRTAGTRSYLTTSISVTVLSVQHLILALSTAFSVQLQSLLGQEDMQIRHLCASENQPCPDRMGLTEDMSPGFSTFGAHLGFILHYFKR